VRLRAERLGLSDAPVDLACETSLASILATLEHGRPADLVVIGTPIDLRRVIDIRKPAVRVRYDLEVLPAGRRLERIDGVRGDEQPVEIARVVEAEGMRRRGRQCVGTAAVEGDAGPSGETGCVPQTVQVRPDGQERPRPGAGSRPVPKRSTRRCRQWP